MILDKTPIQRFIGQGIVFPLVLSNGKTPIVSGFELIRSSIRMILGWPNGTRYYLAEFGSRLEELLEEPNDEVLKAVVRTFVIDAITDWEKRIYLVSSEIVNVTPTRVDIQLTYRVVNSQTEDTYIFPFYRKINT